MRVTFSENNLEAHYFTLSIFDCCAPAYPDGQEIGDLYLRHYVQYSTIRTLNDSPVALAQLLCFADMSCELFAIEHWLQTFPFSSILSRGTLFTKFTPELARQIIQDRSIDLVWDTDNPATNYRFDMFPTTEQHYMS